MELESDDELSREIQSALAAAEPPVTTSPAAPSSSTSTSSGSLSSSSGEYVKGRGSGSKEQATASDAGAGPKLPESGSAGLAGRRPAASTSTEGSSYNVSTSNPVEVATALGMPKARLIGGNIVGSLRFSSSDQER